MQGRVEGVRERGYFDIKYSDGDDESVDAESLQKILRDWLQDNSLSAKTRKEIITSLMIDKQVDGLVGRWEGDSTPHRSTERTPRTGSLERTYK